MALIFVFPVILMFWEFPLFIQVGAWRGGAAVVCCWLLQDRTSQGPKPATQIQYQYKPWHLSTIVHYQHPRKIMHT